MKLNIFFASLILIGFQDLSMGQNFPDINAIINSVNIDSLRHSVAQLSGETSIFIDGVEDTILTRHAGEADNDLASKFIKQELDRHGVETFEQNYDPISRGKNIYGVKWGEVYPDKHYIICAHFDDKPIGPIAPGADDNASGVAAVLEAARIFADYSTQHSIIFALWDEEEIGLIGSRHFAEDARSNQMEILGVINMDMIAYDSNNDRIAEIHINNSPENVWLAAQMVEVNENYSIGLELQVINPGTTASDHSPFWEYDYSALLLIEDIRNNLFSESDFNPYYHKVDDRLISFDLTYFELCAKVSIGTIAKLDGIDPTTSSDDIEYVPLTIELKQNYPNPFNPSTIIEYSIAEDSFVKLQVFDVLGNTIATLVDDFVSAGNYKVEFDTGRQSRELSSGVYFYNIVAGKQKAARKMIISK